MGNNSPDRPVKYFLEAQREICDLALAFERGWLVDFLEAEDHANQSR